MPTSPPIPYGLTPKQAQKPYSAVQFSGYGSVSILERSFIRGSLDEIEFWDQSGILDEALSGAAPGKRDYQTLLVQHLLDNRKHGFWVQEDGWDRILRKLWDAGASQQTQHHGRWIHTLAGHWLFDVMLDAGVSPHAAAMGNSAAHNLANGISRAEEYGQLKVLSSPFMKDIQACKEQLQRCVDFPEATPSQLTNLLACIVRCGLNSDNQAQWRQWRDQLIVRGADPFSDFGYVMGTFCWNGPGLNCISRYDLNRALQREGVKIDISKPPEAYEIERSLQLRKERDEQWNERSMEWLDAFASCIQNRPTDMGPPSIDVQEWRQLLDKPNGVELCKKALIAGVRPPWSGEANANHRHEKASILVSGWERDPSRLERLVDLLEWHRSQVNPEWIKDVVIGYSSAIYCKDSRLFPAYSEEIFTYEGKKRAHGEPNSRVALSHEEIENLLRLEGWSPGRPLSQTMLSLVGRRRFEPDMENEVRFLVKSGLLEQALLPNTSEMHLLHRDDLGRYGDWTMGNGWFSDPQVYQTVVKQDPRLGWPLASLAIAYYSRLQDYDQERLEQWLDILEKDYPEIKTRVIDEMFYSLEKNLVAYAKSGNMAYLLTLLKHGSSPSRETICNLAAQVFLAIPPMGVVCQEKVMDTLPLLGVGMDQLGRFLVNAVIEWETSRGGIRLEAYQPLASRLIKQGADLGGIDFGGALRPFKEFVRVEWSRHTLEQSTSMPASTHRPLRF